MIHVQDSMTFSTGWWFGTFFIFHNIWDNPSHWLSYFSRWLKPPASWFPPASLIIGWWLSQANLRRSRIHPKHCRWRRPRGTRAPYITMVVTNAKETWHVRIGIAEVWRYSIHMGLNVGSPNDIGQVLNGQKISSLPITTIPQMSISSESFWIQIPPKKLHHSQNDASDTSIMRRYLYHLVSTGHIIYICTSLVIVYHLLSLWIYLTNWHSIYLSISLYFFA